MRNVPFGFVMMFVAGVFSGFLGIGSGAFKALAMPVMPGVPVGSRLGAKVLAHTETRVLRAVYC